MPVDSYMGLGEAKFVGFEVMMLSNTQVIL